MKWNEMKWNEMKWNEKQFPFTTVLFTLFMLITLLVFFFQIWISMLKIQCSVISVAFSALNLLCFIANFCLCYDSIIFMLYAMVHRPNMLILVDVISKPTIPTYLLSWSSYFAWSQR